MPITDVPPSPPSSSSPSPESGYEPTPELRPPAPAKRRKRGDYTDMESHELLVVIDELEDERSRLRRREGIWVSVLAHILIFAGLYLLPRYFPQVHVVNPSDAVKEQQRDMTVLHLPPSVLKDLRPTPPPRSSVPSPAPSPAPALQAPSAPKPAPPPPQIAQQQPPPEIPQPQPPVVTQPLPPNPHSQLDAPRPTPTKPSFSTSDTAPGDAVREAARAAARGGGIQSGSAPGAPGRGRAAGLQGGAQVLSDTGGWDPNAYVRRVVYDTEQAWYPIIPEEVRAPLLKKGIVGIRFKIMRDGSVQGMTLEGRSGDVALDRAAWGGITGASPYPPLPAEFKGPFLELRFGFFYNQEPGLR
ncbi:MAG TPA: energy transducer TonB [Acidisarcina sp.]